jgi:hypothetical protein
MKNLIRKILTISTLFILAACGGGGGGGGVITPVASTSSFPLFTIHVNTLQPMSNAFSVSGTIEGIAVTGSGTATRGGLSAGTFEGAPQLQRTIAVTGSISANGQSAPLNSSAIDWYDSNYLPLGNTGGEDYVVVLGNAVIPTSVRVNDTGTVYTATRWSNSSKTFSRGTEVISYVVEADTASTALLTLILTEKDTNNTTLSISSQQFRIRPDGTFTRIKETIIDYSDNISFTLTYN